MCATLSGGALGNAATLELHWIVFPSAVDSLYIPSFRFFQTSRSSVRSTALLCAATKATVSLDSSVAISGLMSSAGDADISIAKWMTPGAKYVRSLAAARTVRVDV